MIRFDIPKIIVSSSTRAKALASPGHIGRPTAPRAIVLKNRVWALGLFFSTKPA